ncbi:MAG TPA: GNAT family N-acetyltransferase [Streptosporangiaceae bacterium]|nr:GNAT family N-acetyltransferase [Streptosporangiaceae bacterium]
MSVRVLDGVAPEWQKHVGDDVPVLASAPWIDATLERLTSRRLTLLATEDGQGGGLQATVVDSPAAGEMISLYRMLLADPKVWKFPGASVAARGDLRGRMPPAEDWLPHLAVLYPGFDSFVAASGGPAPALGAVLVDAVLSWAAEHGMRVVSFPYVRSDTGLPELLAERGFLAIPLTYRSRLTLAEGAGFDDYLASLSKNGRSQVTKERQRLATAGISTVRCAVDDVWSDVLALRCDLVERYGQRADKDLEASNLRALFSCFGTGGTRLYCSFLEGRVVGFSLYLVWRDTWYAGYTGTYLTPQTRSVYFDHLFYAPIADAIAEGTRVVDLGIGAWEGKRRRGCELTEVNLWVRAADPAIERAISLAAAPMRREVGW